MDYSQDAQALIKELGGTSAAAKALGLSASTVSYWNVENKIPSWRLDAVLKAVRESKKRRTAA